jgi:hypothetical protein
MPEPQPETEVVISKSSQRLEVLEPFRSHFAEDSGNPRGLELPACKVLMRVRGKCTTDHISAAVGYGFFYFASVLMTALYRAHGSNTRGISPTSLRIFVSNSPKIILLLILIVFIVITVS